MTRRSYWWIPIAAGVVVLVATIGAVAMIVHAPKAALWALGGATTAGLVTDGVEGGLFWLAGAIVWLGARSLHNLVGVPWVAVIAVLAAAAVLLVVTMARLVMYAGRADDDWLD